MSVVFGCPGCGKGIEGAAGAEASCPRCGAKGTLAPADGELDKCLACGCPDLYRHRDFNQKLGLAVIAVGAIAWIWTGSFWPMVAAAAFDLLLYYLIADVVICYRCKAHHRGFPGVFKIPAFDLEKHEHHRFKKARDEGRIPPRNQT